MLYSIDNFLTYQPFTLPGDNYTFSLTTPYPGNGENTTFRLYTIANGQWSMPNTLVERPVLTTIEVDPNGLFLRTTWNQQVTFNTGNILLTGDQTGTATYTSNPDPNILLFTIDTTINQGVDLFATIANFLAEGPTSAQSVAMNPAVTNDSTVIGGGTGTCGDPYLRGVGTTGSFTVSTGCRCR